MHVGAAGTAYLEGERQGARVEHRLATGEHLGPKMRSQRGLLPKSSDPPGTRVSKTRHGGYVFALCPKSPPLDKGIPAEYP